MTNGHAALTGGCQCGRVRYATSVVPDDVSVCHCRMCQKAVGGPFIALALVHPDQITWTRGKPASFRSSSIATRLYCADCGTPLAYVGDEKGDVELTTGSFDEPERLVPTRSTGDESRLHWIDKLASLPGKTTQDLHTARNQVPIVSFQHPDRDTPPDWSPPRDRAGAP
jgi:hypothetical protein